MGYRIYMREVDLRIRKENFDAALSAVKTAFSSSWTEHLDTFEEAMSDFGYVPEYDEDGNIDGFEFIGEKLRNDREFWDTVAPFVEEGCYLEVEGDALKSGGGSSEMGKSLYSTRYSCGMTMRKNHAKRLPEQCGLHQCC